MPHVLLVAAENDALPGGKVGGIGDVVRDLPPALAAEKDWRVTVVTPTYGVFAELPGSRREAVLEVGFAGVSRHVELYRLPVDGPEQVTHLGLQHPLFAACGRGRIYCDDPPHSPFATDASKFALFCAAVCEGLSGGVFGPVDVLHLHDWHTALVLALCRYHPAYAELRRLHSVYTIHNLALQGVRPFFGHESSLAHWYPDLRPELAALADPRWPNCVNPMAVGVRLADRVHTVSPSYAEEIQRPSAVAARGYYGGEGLEADLQTAGAQGRLVGILNGCEYPPGADYSPDPWPELLTRLRAQLLTWAGAGPTVSSAHFIAHARLAALSDRRPAPLVTSVGRITEQKVRLLRQNLADGRPALDALLTELAEAGGLLLLLGSGDADYEQFLTASAARHENFIFLRGYSDPLARSLYRSGDLFLMPSSFEPCGISQMLAMRAGQPCLVHSVGGLRDTVTPDHDGFGFGGEGLTEQAEALLDTLRHALAVYRRPAQWRQIAAAAAERRFRWADSVADYLKQLYN